MRSRTDAQRRAMFASMRTQPGRHWPTRRGFPTHGRGGIATRNRELAGALGLTAGGLTLMGATEAGRKGPLRALTGLTGHRNYGATVRHGYEHLPTFSSSRGASRVEVALAEGLRRLAPRATRPIRRAMGITSSRPRAGLARSFEVSGTPLDARFRAFARAHVARRVEQASLWNVLGPGRLHHAIEHGSLAAQLGVRRLAARVVRGRSRVLERGVRRIAWKGTRPLLRWNRQLARGLRVSGERLALHALKEAAA